MNDAGTYALVIFCEESLQLQIGRLGNFEFSTGFYIYIGSALRGMKSRLKRHLESEKKLHWHVDYFLRYARVVQIWYALSGDRLECTWNEIVSGLSGATPFIRGFGSSDCRCWTHLTRFSNEPSFESFRKETEKCGLPRIKKRKI